MSDIVERLLKDAESHYEVARSADMRPEDTLNWAHGQNCQEAADTITRLQYDLADAITEQQWQRGKAEDLGKLATSLTAEVERLRSVTVVQEALIRKAEAENERLRAALKRIAFT
jgi:YD repeat-containing protein